MITTILKTLNGHGSEAASLEAALLQLSRDRDETRTKFAELKKQRHTALLDDLDDATIGKIDLLIDRAEVRLEKLNAAEPPLLEKLTGARTAARQKRWRALREAYAAAAAGFLASARGALDKHVALVAIVGQAQREGFEREVAASMPPAPNLNGHPVLAQDLLDIFERSIAPPAAPAKKTAATRPQAQKLPQSESMQHAVHVERGVELHPMTARRMPDDTAPLNAGQARVKVLRGGFSPADDRPQCHFGQVIRLPVAQAEHLENMGIVEIINGGRSSVEERLEIRPAGSSQHPIHASSAGTAAAAAEHSNVKEL